MTLQFAYDVSETYGTFFDDVHISCHYDKPKRVIYADGWDD